MNILQLIPYAYRAFEAEDDIEDIIKRLQPYVPIVTKLINMARKDADLWEKIATVYAKLVPQDAAAPQLPSVTWIQTKLNVWANAKGFPRIAVDGKYGPESQESTTRFQQFSGIEVDGLFGAETYQAMVKWLKDNGLQTA